MSNETIWRPEEDEMKNTRLYKWMESLGYSDYSLFHQKSIEDIRWFWDQAVKVLGISWYKEYDAILERGRDWKYPVWFRGGKMNIVENAIGKWAKDPDTAGNQALIWEGDDGASLTYTFAELQKAVHSAAAGFLKLGIKKGEVVTLYMPMIPETVISMLALAKIGAIFSPVFSGYGSEAVATRIQAADAKYVITADGYYRRGKKVLMKHEADKAIEKSPSVKTCIVVNRISEPVSWNIGRDIHWDSLISNNQQVETLQTSAEDPFMLIYTSGTTGKPKGAVHTHGGFPIKAAFDAGIGMDVKQGDTFFWYSDMGWMMGPFLVFGGLVNGAAIVLYEGAPDFPHNDRLFAICSKYGVTHLGVSPTFVRSIMNGDPARIQSHDLSKLRAIGSTGEPWNPDPWLWLFTTVCKEKIPIINYSGGTEISGGILGNTLLKAITPITFNTPLLGMDVDVFDSEGTPVSNDVGELVIKQPWVGMTNGFWKENKRYENAYWNRWEHVWVHGDWVIKDDEGYWTITGRSDDTLNIAGKRVGPAEFESVLVTHPAVIESASIGVPHPVKGETTVCFAVIDGLPSESLQQELIELVALHMGKALKPESVHFVPQLPKTRNGKVMRRVIKSAYLNQPEGDLSSLENPESIEAIKNLCNTMKMAD